MATANFHLWPKNYDLVSSLNSTPHVSSKRNVRICLHLFILGGPGGLATLSGLQEPDYPAMEGSGLNQRSMVRKVPLPAELVEHFGHMQCNCLIGLFPELERAWLTIDSDIYVWRFSDGRDLAYYDGLADTILSVGLLQPKKGIFRPHIKHLLCLTTPVEIVLLGKYLEQYS